MGLPVYVYRAVRRAAADVYRCACGSHGGIEAVEGRLEEVNGRRCRIVEWFCHDCRRRWTTDVNLSTIDERL